MIDVEAMSDNVNNCHRTKRCAYTVSSTNNQYLPTSRFEVINKRHLAAGFRLPKLHNSGRGRRGGNKEREGEGRREKAG